MATKVATTREVTFAPADERTVREIVRTALREELRDAIVEELRGRRGFLANVVGLLWGAILGAAIGAVAGLVLAPSEGRSMRDRLSARLGTWFGGTQDHLAPQSWPQTPSAAEGVAAVQTTPATERASDTPAVIPVTPRTTTGGSVA